MTLDLKAAIVSGVRWTVIGQVGRQILAVVVSVVLARHLAPSDFGLIAMLFVFQEAANALVNSGLNASLIQSKEITEVDCSTIFFFNIGVAIVCYASLIAGAHQIAIFYREPLLEGIVPLYGLVFVIHAMCNVQVGLLIRTLDFRTQNIVSMIGLFVSGIVAIALAVGGFGVYALLGQHLANALVTNVLYWFGSRWRPVLSWSGTSFRRLFRFGSTVLVISMLDKILTTLDAVIVGRLQGASMLGQYSRGATTRDLPLNQINGIVSALIFPFFSRVSDPQAVRNALQRVVGLTSYVTAPAMVGLAVVADPLIRLLYSPTWLPAVPFLRLFCPIGLTIPLNAVLVHTIMARGDSGSLLRLELAKKTVLVMALITGALLDPTGLVLVLTSGHYLMLALSFREAARGAQCETVRLVARSLPGVGFALAMGLPLALLQCLTWSSSLVNLLVSVPTGAVVYLLLSEIFRSRDLSQMKALIRGGLWRSA